MSRPPATTPLGKVIDFLGSFGFAVVLLVFLLLTTWLGTLEQVDTSLYEVQRKYFESIVIFHDVGPVPIPLPGVYLLLWLLFVNLIVGGILRMRWSMRTAGILVVHFGIILLMAGSLVEYAQSNKGHTSLREGEESDEFQSYHEWEITVTRGPEEATEELVIPGERFIDLDEDSRAVFTSPDLPFRLEVYGVLKNCDPVPAETARKSGLQVVDGYALKPLPQEKQSERDIAGARVDIVMNDGGREQAILWGAERYDHSVVVDGTRYAIGLYRRRWKLPFTVVLDDFRKVDHPGMTMAKSYESDILKVQEGVTEPVLIRMNEPLRHEGYTLYQSGWQPPDPGDTRFMSTFAVVRNPADNIPLYACLVITLGLLMHFGNKLVALILRQSKKPVAVPSPPPPPAPKPVGGAA